MVQFDFKLRFDSDPSVSFNSSVPPIRFTNSVLIWFQFLVPGWIRRRDLSLSLSLYLFYMYIYIYINIQRCLFCEHRLHVYKSPTRLHFLQHTLFMTLTLGPRGPGSCGPLWALLGWALAGGHAWALAGQALWPPHGPLCELGPCGSSLGLLSARPLWASLCSCGPGPCGPPWVLVGRPLLGPLSS